MHLDGRKPRGRENGAHGSTILLYQSVRETVLASCGIPSRITCNDVTQATMPIVLCVQHSKKNKIKMEKEKHEED